MSRFFPLSCDSFNPLYPRGRSFWLFLDDANISRGIKKPVKISLPRLKITLESAFAWISYSDFDRKLTCLESNVDLDSWQIIFDLSALINFVILLFSLLQAILHRLLRN